MAEVVVAAGAVDGDAIDGHCLGSEAADLGASRTTRRTPASVDDLDC